MKKVAILQSNYIPWKGYFDIIHDVDAFILYDDMQFTKNDWRNRNKVVTAGGLTWLTIPVKTRGRATQRINETIVLDQRWIDKHQKTLSIHYQKAPHAGDFLDTVMDTYDQCRQLQSLSEINLLFIRLICRRLGITTHISLSSDYMLADGKTERLIALCQEVGGDHYLSGPAAKDYLDESLFAAAGICLSYKDYSGYPVYRQQYGGAFEHGVSVLDLLLNTGDEAPQYIWGWREHAHGAQDAHHGSDSLL